MGLPETKVKAQNMARVMEAVCPNWQWEHNATEIERGRISVGSHPKMYHFKMIQKSDQLIHGEAIQHSTNKRFYITFVYGRNHEDQRTSLWDTLMNISQVMDEPWCIVGDFNSVIHQEERIGRIEVGD